MASVDLRIIHDFNPLVDEQFIVFLVEANIVKYSQNFSGSSFRY